MEEVFYNNGGVTLKHVAQRDGGCPISEDIRDQAGRGSEQLDGATSVPVHCTVGLDHL